MTATDASTADLSVAATFPDEFADDDIIISAPPLLTEDDVRGGTGRTGALSETDVHEARCCGSNMCRSCHLAGRHGVGCDWHPGVIYIQYRRRSFYSGRMQHF